MVLLPDPDRPVNHRVAPCCLSSPSRSSRVTCPSCQVIFVALIAVIGLCLLEGTSGSFYGWRGRSTSKFRRQGASGPRVGRFPADRGSRAAADAGRNLTFSMSIDTLIV